MSDKTPYDFGTAVTHVWNLPGGAGFVWRVLGALLALDILIMVVLGRGIIQGYIDIFSLSFEIESNEMTEWEEVSAVMGGMIPLFLNFAALGFLTWLVHTSAETALHKNALRGTDEGLFPLRFGADEIRVLAVKLVIWIALILAYIVMFGVPFAMIFASAGPGGEPSGAVGGFAFLWFFIGIFAFVIGLVYFAIKLSAATALTVRDEKIRILESMKATKGRGWIMLGTFLVIGLIGYVVTTIIYYIGIFAVIGDGSLFEAFSDMSEGNTEEAVDILKAHFSQPSVLAIICVTGILYWAVYMLWYFHFWCVGNYVAKLDEQDQSGLGSLSGDLS